MLDSSLPLHLFRQQLRPPVQLQSPTSDLRTMLSSYLVAATVDKRARSLTLRRFYWCQILEIITDTFNSDTFLVSQTVLVTIWHFICSHWKTSSPSRNGNQGHHSHLVKLAWVYILSLHQHTFPFLTVVSTRIVLHAARINCITIKDIAKLYSVQHYLSLKFLCRKYSLNSHIASIYV